MAMNTTQAAAPAEDLAAIEGKTAISIDAMGGDRGPAVVVAGLALATAVAGLALRGEVAASGEL